jgi:hypothetical protein
VPGQLTFLIKIKWELHNFGLPQSVDVRGDVGIYDAALFMTE